MYHRDRLIDLIYIKDDFACYKENGLFTNGTETTGYSYKKREKMIFSSPHDKEKSPVGCEYNWGCKDFHKTM